MIYVAIEVSFGKENATSVGPWTVISEVVSISDQHVAHGAENLLEQKAVSSMASLFDGFVSYYLETTVSNDVPKPLVFISDFTRESRPRAWKKADLKIQSTLPLLGNDEMLADGAHRLLVKVTLTLKGTDREHEA